MAPPTYDEIRAATIEAAEAAKKEAESTASAAASVAGAATDTVGEIVDDAVTGVGRHFDDVYYAAYAAGIPEPPDPGASFSDDCYLMDYLDIFVNMNMNICNPNGYKNFKVLNAPEESGGGAPEIISRLTSRDGLRRFLDITPSQVAILQPRIRLFKLVYTDSSSKPAKEEFIFDDHYSRKGVDAILGGKTKRIGGAGLTDVNWAFKGTNPASGDKIIDVEMSFEFQSAADFLGHRYDPADGNIVTDSDLDKKASFVDMILHPPNKLDALGAKAQLAATNGEYVPTYYRVGMEIGWSIPELGVEKKFPGLNVQESRDLRDALNAQSHTIILNLQEHKIDITENGGMSIDITFVGAMEIAMDDPKEANILDTSDSKWGIHDDGQVQYKIAKTKSRIEDLEERIKCLDLASPPGSPSTVEDDDDVMQNTLDMWNEELSKHEEQFKVNTEHAKFDVYDKFLDKLKPKIRKIEMNQAIVGKWLMSIDKGSPRPNFFGNIQDDGLWGVVTNGTHKRGVALGEYNSDNVSAAGRQTMEALGEIANQDSSDADAEEELDAAVRESTTGTDTEDWIGSGTTHKDADPQAAEEAAVKLEEKAEDIEKKFLRFIFLGDLINAACYMMSPGTALPSDDFRIATGPAIFHHPRGKQAMKFNLADLPISYDRLAAFFLDKVVKPSLDHYTIKSFINDILDNIVKDMLTVTKCFPRREKVQLLKFKQTQFDISTRTAEQAGFFTFCHGRFNVGDLPKQNPIPYGMEDHKVTVGLFYLSTEKASDLRGYSDGDASGNFNDREKGIYHFHIGGEAGILKKIDFEKSDIEGLREARQSKAYGLTQFRDLYNAKVTLAGNTLFIPGMTVFIHPPIGMGLPQQDGSTSDADGNTVPGNGLGSISNLMGMGGYYSIVSVESNISSNGQYETVLECIFSQSGGAIDSKDAECKEVLQQMIDHPNTVWATGTGEDRAIKLQLAREGLSALERQEGE